MQEYAGVDVVVTADLIEGRQQAVGIVVDMIAFPGMFGVAFVGGTGAQKKMGVAVRGLVAETLLEDVEVVLFSIRRSSALAPVGNCERPSWWLWVVVKPSDTPSIRPASKSSSQSSNRLP